MFRRESQIYFLNIIFKKLEIHLEVNWELENNLVL